MPYKSEKIPLGKSDCNWYFVDGEWRKYVKGERIE